MDESSHSRSPFTHALGSLDAITGTLLLILIVTSVASWCVIVWRTRRAVSEKAATRATATALTASENLSELRAALDNTPVEFQGATYLLATDALTILPTYGSSEPAILARLERRLRHGIEEHLATYEQGLGLLATTAAVAPFVGLLGTVWGIYHALTGLAAPGAAAGLSIERVAGPVGEALVMTGVGLAVAIPAAVAYNVFARSSRRLGHDLDATAHRLRDLAEPFDLPFSTPVPHPMGEPTDLLPQAG